MNKKILIASFAAFIVMAAAGAGIASAHGFGFGFSKNLSPEEIAVHQEEMFAKKAEILGISVEEIKEKWAEGKNMREIAEEAGINKEELHEKMSEIRKEQMKEKIQSLVDQGVITQEQADKRIENTEEKGFFGGFGRKGGKKGAGEGCPFHSN